jgi:hypothetical protein
MSTPFSQFSQLRKPLPPRTFRPHERSGSAPMPPDSQCRRPNRGELPRLPNPTDNSSVDLAKFATITVCRSAVLTRTNRFFSQTNGDCNKTRLDGKQRPPQRQRNQNIFLTRGRSIFISTATHFNFTFAICNLHFAISIHSLEFSPQSSTMKDCEQIILQGGKLLGFE